MKKLVLVLAAAALTLTSCSISKQTAHTQQICTSIRSGATATLEVSPKKISYTYVPSKAVRKGGYQNCINAAVREALLQNGNADAGEEIPKTEVVELIEKGAQVYRSARYQSSYLLYKDGGKTKVVWYESDADLAEKVMLC